MIVTSDTHRKVDDRHKTFDDAVDAHDDGASGPEVEEILYRAFRGEELDKAFKEVTRGVYHA